MGATDSHMIRSFFNFQPTPEDVAGWMKAEDIAAVLIDLLREGPGGRTGTRRAPHPGQRASHGRNRY